MPMIAPLVVEPCGNATVSSAEADAVSALIALGFRPQRASHTAAAAPGEGLFNEKMIRQVPKGMAWVAPNDRARSPHIRRSQSRTR